MKRAENIVRLLTIAMAMMMALPACDSIDDDLTDCGQDVKLTYVMHLVTNRDDEIAARLDQPGDKPAELALRAALEDVFTDYAHDLKLRYYTPDSTLSLAQRQDMNATQASYTIYFDQGAYDHWALVNHDREPRLDLRGDDRCPISRLVQVPPGEVVPSQKVGVFSGRHQFDVVVGDVTEHIIPLYQVNSAVNVVVDTAGFDISGIDIYVDDLAYSFHLRDSVYHYGDPQAVRADVLDLTPHLAGATSTLASYLAVALPSQNTAIADDGTVWRVRVYVELADGSITENVVKVTERLRAGFLKILRLKMTPQGVVESVNAEASVSVTLNWHAGPTFHPVFY